jgi:predicted nucleotidyltransferase
MQAKGNNIMIQSGRDYSEEIINLCKQHNVKYLGLRGSSYDQENIGIEEPEIYLLVEFFPMEPKQYARCYFGLERELEEFFGREVIMCDLTGITLPELLRMLTKRKTDIYKA